MGEFIDKAKGAVKEVIGEAKLHSSNPETRAKGLAQKTEGKIDKIKGSIKGALGDHI